MATDLVAGIAMVKDEVDIVGSVVEHMLEQVDFVIVADNGSTDGTRTTLVLIATNPEANHRLTVIDDPEPAYYQAKKMTALAAQAAELGASWVVPFDADEWWVSPQGRIADVLREAGGAVAAATVYDHVATGSDPRDIPVKRIGWRRRDPVPLPKVACRPALPVSIHQGNHGASYDATIVHDLLQVHHFPYRSGEQFVSKVRNGAAAYAATDLPDDVGAHWRQYGRHLDENGPDALINDVFRQHFWVADPEADPGLIYDPVQ